LLPDLERMAAQCLGALSGLDRQKMRQHASRDAIGGVDGPHSASSYQSAGR
jgi:hypothetical protein